MSADRGEADGDTAATGSGGTSDTAPRAIALATDTAELLAVRAAALGISVGELIAALAAGANPAVPAKSESPALGGNATSGGARWSEVKAWIDSWGKPDERPRPKLGK